jgi:hypothetical protein
MLEDRYTIALNAFDLLDNLPPAIGNRAADIMWNIDDAYDFNRLTEETLPAYWQQYTDAVTDLLFMLNRINRRHLYALVGLRKALDAGRPLILYLRDYSLGRHHVWQSRYQDSRSKQERMKLFEVMPFDDQFVQQAVLKYSQDHDVMAISLQDFRSFDVSRLNPARVALVSLLVPGVQWTEVVDFLIGQAALIVMAVRELSPGTRLEIERIHRHNKQQATVVVTMDEWAFEEALAEVRRLTEGGDRRGPEIAPPIEDDSLRLSIGNIHHVVTFTTDPVANDSLFAAAAADIFHAPTKTTFADFRRTYTSMGFAECLEPAFLASVQRECAVAEADLVARSQRLAPIHQARTLFDLLALFAIQDNTQGVILCIALAHILFLDFGEAVTAATLRTIGVQFLADIEHLEPHDADARFEAIRLSYMRAPESLGE